VLVHAVAEGRSYQPAENTRTASRRRQVRLRQPVPRPRARAKQPTTRTFLKALIAEAEHDKIIVAITPPSVRHRRQSLPDRFLPQRALFDVGIAEQHAVTFATQATEGIKPFCAISFDLPAARSNDQWCTTSGHPAAAGAFAIDRPACRWPHCAKPIAGSFPTLPTCRPCGISSFMAAPTNWSSSYGGDLGGRRSTTVPGFPLSSARRRQSSGIELPARRQRPLAIARAQSFARAPVSAAQSSARGCGMLKAGRQLGGGGPLDQLSPMRASPATRRRADPRLAAEHEVSDHLEECASAAPQPCAALSRRYRPARAG